MNLRHICKFVLVSLAAFAVSGCTDDYPCSMTEESRFPITLSAAYPSATRASDAGFEDGDRMGIYVLDYSDGKPQQIGAVDANASNVRFDFNGSNNSWTGARDLFWKDGETPTDIIAYYPYISNIGNPEEMAFSVSRHQEIAGSESLPGGYESSDLLRGVAEKQMPTEGKVQLTLNHVLAGVRITLKEGSGFASGEWSAVEKSVVLPGTVLRGTVNLRDGSVKVGSSSPEPIVPMPYNNDYRAIVFPQTVGAGISLVAVSVDGVGYNLIKQEPTTLVGGKMHAFTIIVDKKSNGNYEFSLLDEAIIRWMDDVEFRDGVIRSYTTVNVAKRGSLKDILRKEGFNYKEISNLKLTGEINESDFFFMRDEMLSLKALNLKDAKVYDENRVDVIPARAMYRKTSLTRIVFPEHLKIIGSSAFHRSGLMGDLVIPEGVEKIGESLDYGGDFGVGSQSNGAQGAFSYCQNLLGGLSLPLTLTHIEHGAFTYDEFEGSLILPKNLKFIGDYAFWANNYTGELKIPETVDYIGSGTFGRTRFTGSLELPAGIEVIKCFAFNDASFSGSLILPDGLLEIQKHAFDGCNFRGELLLPTSLRSLGDYAFSNTRISNIVFPQGLTSIGKGCFMNCAYLNERIVIPENVSRINEYTFAGDILLSEVELHENVTFVGGGAFVGDLNLTDITIKNPTPPSVSIVSEYDWDIDDYIEKDAFYGVPLGNVTLKIPEGARDAYSRAEVWKNIGRHATSHGFGCRPEKICALNNAHQESIIVDSNGDWEVSHLPSWCNISANSGNGKTQLTVNVSGLLKGSGMREDYIEFRMKGTEYTARCNIKQLDYQYDEDECITLQKASKGSGINILFVSDGFDATAIANGEYLALVNEQMDAFFGVEPYTTYKDYFNVYACISLSQETGVSTTSTRKNTRFLTRFDNGTGCSVKGLACDNPDNVFDYAVVHSPLTRDKMSKSLVIMALNSDQYGSVTVLTDNGSAIAIVGRSSDPYPMDTRGMLQHEACGHAFGKLAEERIVENRYVKDKEKQEIYEMFWRGWYRNISLTGKINEVNWADLVFDPRYSNNVDVFEGGYGLTRGVFRAEINSCMNYGIPYFSAPARRDIMRRILDYSGEGFTMEKFYETDTDKWGATSSTRTALPGDDKAYVASGMHHPVRIVKSKKY
ncbi:MAG: leucine-rich repeat protein [Prevotella sp.]|nr:leucine-rich repeat protein [Prevotella sp.]